MYCLSGYTWWTKEESAEIVRSSSAWARLGAGTRAIALVLRRAGLGLGLLSVEQGEGFVEGLFDNAG